MKYLLCALVVQLTVYWPASALAFYNPASGRWLSRDPLGEAGGLNQCTTGGNDEINNIDPFGLWSIGRFGLPRATAFAAEGDTIRGLAAKIRLNASEFQRWLQPVVLVSRPYALDTPLTSCDLFTIPNTAYIDYDVGPYGAAWGMQYLRHLFKHHWESQGFHVVSSRWTMSRDLVLAHLNDPDIYYYLFIGHGVGGHLQPGWDDLDSGKYTPFGIAGMLLVACDTDRQWTYWRDNVSQAGHLLTCVGQVTLFNFDYRIH